MNDWRTKIAVLATVLGLGALGGYAMSANRRADTAATTTSSIPATKVIRRTVHAKPKHPRRSRAAAPPPATLASSPVSSGTSGASSSAPVSTGTSGSGGGGSVSTGTSGSGGGGESEGGGEREGGGGGDD